MILARHLGRVALFLAALCGGLAQAADARNSGMGVDEARLLLNRTGFGAKPQEIAEFARLSRTDAVDKLLRGTQTVARTPAPEWADEYVRPALLRDASVEERKAMQRQQFERAIDLRGWWLQEMLTTPTPLTERMTLFWHNHFVSSQQKVKAHKLMYRQNLLLRRYAVGNFAEMLHAVAKDPAMIVYLDAATNRRGQPNENFAREVMELFTLGEGRYTEQDIREAARAYTGWSIERDTGEFRWRPMAHDSDPKTVLGRSGNFDGDAVLDILLAQPATAEFIAAKLWREFVSAAPANTEEKRELARVAKRFRDSGYEIKAALRELLLSPAFYAPENRAALVKSPVDLVVGSLRQLDVSIGDPLPFTLAVTQLGQNLFAPPNVKGWPGGEAWINSTTLLARKQFLERLLRVDDMAGMRMNDLGRVQGAARLGMDGKERFAHAVAEVRMDSPAWFGRMPAGANVTPQRVLLAGEPAAPLPGGMPEREVLRALLLDPMYQLK